MALVTETGTEAVQMGWTYRWQMGCPMLESGIGLPQAMVVAVQRGYSKRRDSATAEAFKIGMDFQSMGTAAVAFATRPVALLSFCHLP